MSTGGLEGQPDEVVDVEEITRLEVVLGELVAHIQDDGADALIEEAHGVLAHAQAGRHEFGLSLQRPGADDRHRLGVEGPKEIRR